MNENRQARLEGSRQIKHKDESQQQSVIGKFIRQGALLCWLTLYSIMGINKRSIYSHLYGGVLWGQHDVVLDDIERVELIPDASAWTVPFLLLSHWRKTKSLNPLPRPNTLLTPMSLSPTWTLIP